MQKEIFEIFGVQCLNCGYLVSGSGKCPSCDENLKVIMMEDEVQKLSDASPKLSDPPDPNQFTLF